MAANTPENTINIGIFAHVDAGKATLTEQLLLLCGIIRQAGSVDSGTAQTDYLSVERERGISVMATTTDIEWRITTSTSLTLPATLTLQAKQSAP